MNCISWYDAFAFCIWDGGRLPTSAEWELAAVGGDEQRTYPWGEDVPSLQRATYDCFADGDCTFDEIPAVASRTSLGAGKWGHVDLVGSLAEWVLDFDATLPEQCTDCAALVPSSSPDNRLARGGAWTHAAVTMQSRYSYTSAQMTARVRDIGVRCARDP